MSSGAVGWSSHHGLGGLPLPCGERVGVRGYSSIDRPNPLTPPLSQPNSGLPEFGILSWPKSEVSDFGWEREPTEPAAWPAAESPSVVRPSRSGTRLALTAFVTLLFILPALALVFPTLSGRVVDEANILDQATRAALTQKLADLEAKTTDQLVVVTLKSLQGTSIEDFGYQLGRHWRIGQKDKNNGVLLIVVPSERRVRIEVGYGLEGTLTDAVSRLIIDNGIVPRFRANDYPGGITRGVDDIISVLSGDAEEWKQRAAKRPDRTLSWDGIFIIALIVAIFLLVFVLAAGILGGQPNGRRRGSSGSGWASGSSSGSSWSSGSSGGSSGGGFSGGRSEERR